MERDRYESTGGSKSELGENERGWEEECEVDEGKRAGVKEMEG